MPFCALGNRVTDNLILGMASQPTDVRLLPSGELKDIRSKIVEGKLVLFVGQQVSAQRIRVPHWTMDAGELPMLFVYESERRD